MNIEINRIAVITLLAEKSAKLGRTALMKYCYFLQTLRRVPLGYSFSLYSYGPFDSDVLADLGAAESVGGVKTEVEYYPGGYGYRIEPGIRKDGAKRWGADFLQRYESDIDWVLEQFGTLNASQLELASTIVFSDREAAIKGEKLASEQLAQRVQDIKPHFSTAQILDLLSDLKKRNLLKTT